MHKECISLLSKCGSSLPPALPPRPSSILLPCAAGDRTSTTSLMEDLSLTPSLLGDTLFSVRYTIWDFPPLWYPLFCIFPPFYISTILNNNRCLNLTFFGCLPVFLFTVCLIHPTYCIQNILVSNIWKVYHFGYY